MDNITENILNNLIVFLNADINEMPETDFSQFLQAYSILVTHNHQKYGLPDSRTKFRQLDDQITNEGLLKCKSVFSDIQRHLKSKIDLIIDGVKSKKDMDIFEGLDVQLKISLDAKNCSIVPVFMPRGGSEETALNLKVEKKYADLALIDLLLDYDLTPDRLKKCPYCGDYFFQPTNQERLYCTPTHGHLFRKKKPKTK